MFEVYFEQKSGATTLGKATLDITGFFPTLRTTTLNIMTLIKAKLSI
jgi:hypothetical protein